MYFVQSFIDFVFYSRDNSSNCFNHSPFQTTYILLAPKIRITLNGINFKMYFIFFSFTMILIAVFIAFERLIKSIILCHQYSTLFKPRQISNVDILLIIVSQLEFLVAAFLCSHLTLYGQVFKCSETLPKPSIRHSSIASIDVLKDQTWN